MNSPLTPGATPGAPAAAAAAAAAFAALMIAACCGWEHWYGAATAARPSVAAAADTILGGEAGSVPLESSPTEPTRGIDGGIDGGIDAGC